MRIAIGCEFVFDLPLPAHAVVLVEPHPTEARRVERSHFSTEPSLASRVYLDQFGNVCRRLSLPAGPVSLRFDATVTAERVVDEVDENAAERNPADLPDDVLVYLLPSRYCQSDALAPFALEQFGSGVWGWQRVQEISRWVHEAVRFDYASASPFATSSDVLECRTGVCRDFAHLGISICRALNIPARYVFGYLPDIDVPPTDAVMDFCGWGEVYLGDRWYTIDPRNHQRRVGRVVIARGRDAADVAMVTTFGRADLVSMTVRRGGSAWLTPPRGFVALVLFPWVAVVSLQNENHARNDEPASASSGRGVLGANRPRSRSGRGSSRNPGPSAPRTRRIILAARLAHREASLLA